VCTYVGHTRAHDWLAPRLQGTTDNFKIKPDWRACGSAIVDQAKTQKNITKERKESY